MTDEGSGSVVLFSHGTPTWSYEWRHLVAALKPTHRCVTVDHLGFGKSPRPVDGDYRPEAHAARFRGVVKALGLTKYTLVVHDFGGPIALDGALDEPEKVDRLVVFNSFAWPFEGFVPKLVGTGLFRWLYRAFNFSFVISKSAWGDQQTRTAALWAQYTSVFPDADSRARVLWALAKSMTASHDFFASLRDRLSRFEETPVHLVWGLADNAFTPETLQRWKTVWPHATATELKTAGHWPHEEQPQVCVEAVQAFLKT